MDNKRMADACKRKRPHTGVSFLVYFRRDAGMGPFLYVRPYFSRIWIYQIYLQSQIVKVHLIGCEQPGLSLVAGKEDHLSLKGL